MTPKPMPPIKPSAMTILLFGLLLLCGGDCGLDHPCLGDGKRLLLLGADIALLEHVRQATQTLCAIFQLLYGQFSRIRCARLRHRLGQLFLNLLLSLLGNLEVASAGFGKPSDFLENRRTQLAHTIAQSENGLMVRSESGRILVIASRQFKILLSETVYDRIAGDVGANCIQSAHRRQICRVGAQYGFVLI